MSVQRAERQTCALCVPPFKPLRRALFCGLIVTTAGLGGCREDKDPSEAVFDRTVLHTVEITVAEADLGQLATDIDNRVPCDIRYDGTTVTRAGVRQKGNTLVPLGQKPSFSVRFDELVDGAHLFGLEKLLLNSSLQDSTFYGEQMGEGMFALAGIPAPRVAHARVSLNGKELGLYVVVEATDKEFVRDHFGKEHDEGNLYEGPCCGDFVDDIDRLDLDDEKKDGRTRDDIAQLADVILTTPDNELGAALEERLDLDGFLTTYALEAMLGHWDGYSYRANNYYLYNNPEDGRFVFLPHGMDRILRDPETDAPLVSFDPETLPLARLSQRIRSIPELDERWRAELSRLVPEVWDKADVLADIDRLSVVLHSAGTAGAIGEDVLAFDNQVEQLRGTVTERRALLDPAIQCGDGKTEGLETCDDGGTIDGDGCSARCRVEP